MIEKALWKSSPLTLLSMATKRDGAESTIDKIRTKA